MSEVSTAEFYSQWEGAYAANRAFNNAQSLQRREDAIKGLGKIDEFLSLLKRRRMAESDYKLFQELVVPTKITSLEPFLIGASMRGAPSEIQARLENPYTNEVVGRQLDMPLPLLLATRFPDGTYQGFRQDYPDRVSQLLGKTGIRSLRQTLAIGQLGVERTRGLAEGSCRFLEMVIGTVDPGLEWPARTTPEYAAQLFDSLDEVPAFALYPRTKNIRSKSIGDVLDLTQSDVKAQFPRYGQDLIDRATQFEEGFIEAQAAQNMLHGYGLVI